ncbi:MAG: type 2 isopentenyl-diphosphate Delta-isomerase [Deltaproteobacteria bacterium]|nr:type 2 isopentenyl-diphosphate Delta-isomerase [Deltaproteobacteria bacterium]
MSGIYNRKRSHIVICTEKDVAFRQSTLLEEVELLHCALPELDLTDVSLATHIAGHTITHPFIIGAMTGGTGDGNAFNLALARTAAQFETAFCLGSIRPALVDPTCIPEFDVKKEVPNVLVFANIGANQLSTFGAPQILDLARRLADGLMVHLNAGMELIQPSGDTCFSGQVDAIARLVEVAGDFPIVVKETGMGLSLKDGVSLKQVGIKTVETAGAGGTSWIGVETERASGTDKAVGELLRDFGIPTAASISWMHQLGLETIGSGGVYTAMDAARAIRLGSCAVAMARPWLLAYQADGIAGLWALMEELILGLKYLMVCVGVKDISSLQKADCIIGQRLQQYLNFK